MKREKTLKTGGWMFFATAAAYIIFSGATFQYKIDVPEWVDGAVNTTALIVGIFSVALVLIGIFSNKNEAVS